MMKKQKRKFEQKQIDTDSDGQLLSVAFFVAGIFCAISSFVCAYAYWSSGDTACTFGSYISARHPIIDEFDRMMCGIFIKEVSDSAKPIVGTIFFIIVGFGIFLITCKKFIYFSDDKK